jgi:AraC-like DNA-binding protein
MEHPFLASDSDPERDSGTTTLPGGVSGSTTASTAPVQRVSVNGDDPATARRNYERAYEDSRFTVTRGAKPFSFQWMSIGDDRVSLRTATMTGHVTGQTPGLTDYVVSWVQSGGGWIVRRDGQRMSIPRSPFILPFRRPYTVHLTPHRQNSVLFTAGYLEDLATELHAGPSQLISFDLEATPTREAIERWRTALNAATPVLTDEDAPPLLRMNAQRPLALALLQLAPWAVVDLPEPLREPAMARTRLAVEYLHHHAAEPITPADAAKAAGLHTRTLQLHCRRELGMSPTAYLRDIRLGRIRQELSMSSPQETTVAEIAKRWGFVHLGRFASAYRSRFGEGPSQTLRG